MYSFVIVKIMMMMIVLVCGYVVGVLMMHDEVCMIAFRLGWSQ